MRNEANKAIKTLKDLLKKQTKNGKGTNTSNAIKHRVPKISPRKFEKQLEQRILTIEQLLADKKELSTKFRAIKDSNNEQTKSFEKRVKEIKERHLFEVKKNKGSIYGVWEA